MPKLVTLPLFLCQSLAVLLFLTAAQAAPTEFFGGLKNLGGNNRYYEFYWTDSDANVSQYHLQYQIGAGSYQTLYTGINSTWRSVAFERNEWAPSTVVSFRIVSIISGNQNPSPAVVLTMPGANTFAPPGNVVASTVSDEVITLSWTDQSSEDDGLEIWIKGPLSSDFFKLRDWPFSFPPSITISGFEPASQYQFLLRALKATSGSRTYTNPVIATGTTTGFANAPGNFVVNALNERDLEFGWIDPFSNESGFEIQIETADAVGQTSFVTLGTVSPNVTLAGPSTGWVPGLTYRFRVAAYYDNNGTITYSGFSNVVERRLPFHAPTGLAASDVTESSATITWTDQSSAEQGYDILVRQSGQSQYQYWDEVPANQTSYTLAGLPAGTGLQIAVRAFFQYAPNEYSFSELTEPITINTKDTLRQPQFQGWVGQSFSRQLSTTAGSPPVSWSAPSLPDWLSLNSGNGELSGTPPSAGVFEVPLSATFQDGWTTHKTVTIRVIAASGAPVSHDPTSSDAVGVGQVAEWNLAEMFSDPDTPSAVRVQTNLGDYHMALYPQTTPLTVANFLNYVNETNDAGNYNGSIFHRSIPGFVVQGGGFKMTGTPDAFTSLVTRPTVQNESGLTNVRGTVAMAKLGNNPNSATSQFFVNLVDNSANLDEANGGFTVFGRVVGSMTVPDLIAAQSTSTRTVTVNGQSGMALEDFPMMAGSTPTPVQITSIALVPTLNFAVTGNSNPAVVQVVLDGSVLRMTGLSRGVSTVSFSVTDLDGNVLNRQISVLVRETVDEWLLAANLPAGQQAFDADADFDGLTNLEEFAFMGSPLEADDASVRPKAVTVDVSGTVREGIQFNARKFAPGLTYVVESSGNLSPGSWTTIWSWDASSWPPQPGADTASINQPTRVTDLGTHYEFQILDPVAATVGNPRFLRVRLIKDPSPAN